MIRASWSYFLVAGAMTLAAAACSSGFEEDDNGPGGTAGSGGTTGTGGTASTGDGGPVGSGCTDACCPTADICYVDGQTGVGAECLAVRDNSKGTTNRIQMRQTWIQATQPPGNAAGNPIGDIVYGTLSRRSQLPLPQCNPTERDSADLGGYIQLTDFDLDNGVSRVGYAQFVTDGAAAVNDGLCIGTGTYHDPTYALAGPFYDWSERPTGLRPPMSAPYEVGAVTAKRVDEDFDIQDPAQREAILEELENDTVHNGIFYFDEESGTSHGYSPLAWVVVYDNPDTYIAVPIREAETRSRFNDPETRSCVGAFQTGNLEEPDCEPANLTDPATAAWGCAGGSCPDGDPGPASTRGYFLITELEQIFSGVLSSTLCVSYPTFQKSTEDGWAGDWGNNCQGSPQWDPTDEVNGLPMGDWCSKTNSEATADCHDAYRSVSFHTFAGANIKDGTCDL